ncbi:hypothetical protein CTheo_5605 [Ceratobasidium theobromae]|uniref:Uncharacterized protein n=1 Tax=Ceratobasidium theobromae TaxID=1582974 RepID=A0A5N5QH14_9AGAM|nr:hypothetical protein CTheo_5605 [Ceratobasidium theobromae]
MKKFLKDNPGAPRPPGWGKVIKGGRQATVTDILGYHTSQTRSNSTDSLSHHQLKNVPAIQTNLHPYLLGELHAQSEGGSSEPQGPAERRERAAGGEVPSRSDEKGPGVLWGPAGEPPAPPQDGVHGVGRGAGNRLGPATVPLILLPGICGKVAEGGSNRGVDGGPMEDGAMYTSGAMGRSVNLGDGWGRDEGLDIEGRVVDRDLGNGSKMGGMGGSEGNDRVEDGKMEGDGCYLPKGGVPVAARRRFADENLEGDEALWRDVGKEGWTLDDLVDYLQWREWEEEDQEEKAREEEEKREKHKLLMVMEWAGEREMERVF